MDKLYEEARILSIEFGFGRFAEDTELLSDIVNALLRAEQDWKPNHGTKLSSFRYKYAKTATYNWWRNRTKVKKRQFHYKMTSLDKPITHVGDKPIYLKNTVVVRKKDHPYDLDKLVSLVRVANINPKYKELIIEHFIEGATPKELMAKYNISKSTVSWQLKMGLNELRSIIKLSDIDGTKRNKCLLRKSG